MRPSVEELIASCRHSLREVILPNLSDQWATYVAKAMDRILDHLAVRWELEACLLAEDSGELRALLAALAEAAAGSAELNAAAGTLRVAARQPGAAAPVPVSTLAEENEALRMELRRFIEALDVAAGDASEMHESILAFLRRQIDRESRLAQPTFMYFGPRAG